MAMKRKKTPFQVSWGIIFINSFFLVVSAAVILVSVWNASERNARELSEAMMAEIENSVSSRTVSYFQSAQTVNHNLAFLIYRNFADPVNNPDSRSSLFDSYDETLKLYPQFDKVYYANAGGNLVMLYRMDDGSFSRRYVYHTKSLVQTRYEHANPAYYGTYPNADEPAETGYDPRMRSWYTLAEDAKSLTWTPIYLYATNHMPGFTCSAPVFDNRGNLAGVNGLDITLHELSYFLGTIRPTPNTQIVILDRENNLVAIQAHKEEDLSVLFAVDRDSAGNPVYNISTLDALGDENLRSILRRSIQEPGKLTQVRQGNKDYNAILTSVTAGIGLELNIGIVIPEDDIIGHVRENLQTVTFFSIGILAVILVISSLLSRNIVVPMRRLADEMAKIQSFDLDSEVNINTSFLEIKNLRDSFERMRGGLRNFRRYVPADLVGRLVRGEINADLEGEERELTIFCSGIAQFAAVARQMKAGPLVRDLRAYFEAVSTTILENQGTIDQYSGDSVMAFWGAPLPLDNHADLACRSALFIRNNLYNLFQQWTIQGKYPFHTRMGIHTGQVITGNLGYRDRLNYTVIGDAVNVSVRLEELNKVYGTHIIVSEFTRNRCRDSLEFRLLDRVSVAGRGEPFEIYELLALSDIVPASGKPLYQYYETGLRYYFDQKWDEALKYFNTVLKYRPGDAPGKVMRERCLRFMQNPPPPEWNGVFVQSMT